MSVFKPYPRWARFLAWFALLLAANLSIGLTTPLWLKAIGAILLIGVLPGWAFNAVWFSEADELDGWERWAFALGSSFMLSTFAIWLYSFWPGRLSLLGLLGVLDGLSLMLVALALWRNSKQHTSDRSPQRQATHQLLSWLAPFGLIALIALMSFAGLSYSEWEGDEIPVVNDALAMILGDKTAIYRLAKGPTQTLLTVAFMLMGHSLTEGFLRLPFAASAVAAGCAFWMIARRLLPQPFAWLAMFWFSVDGFLVSKARIIQFPILIMLSDLLAFYALWRALQAREAWAQWRWQVLGSLFFAFGLFTHYTGAFIAPALLALWWAAAHPTWRQRATWSRGIALAAVVSACAAPFYVLMFQQPRLSGKVGSYYVGYRVGAGPFNNIPEWAGMMRMYESPFWLLLTALGLALGLAFTASIWGRASRFGRGVFLGVWLGIGIAFGWPQGLMVANVNLAFVPFAALAICMSVTSIETRALWFWALTAFGIPLFWMQVPGDHYNSAIPPLLLLAWMGWRAAGQWLQAHIINAQLWRALKTTAAFVLLGAGVLGMNFTYLMFLSQAPEYATLYPESLPRWLNGFATEAPVTRFGIPHNNGWRAVTALYEQGALRGEYETNEFIAISEWYRAVQWRPPQPQPRYYFYVVHPQPLALASEPPTNLLQTHYLWGQITVHGETRIQIYQRRTATAITEPRTWASEDFDARWQDLTSLSRFLNYKDAQRDESAFYALARHLETVVRPGDAIAFDGAWTRGALMRFYRGDAPLLGSELSGYARVWGVFWASPDRAIERTLATQACPATSQWFGNIRLGLYGVRVLDQVTEVNAQLGEAARLRSFAQSRTPLRRGDILCLQFDWQALTSLESRHKVFVHLVNAAGKIGAQADAEPLGGFAPTTEWQSNQLISDRIGVLLPDTLSPGQYQLFVGLYDAQSGARLPAHAASGARYPNDAISLGSLTLE